MVRLHTSLILATATLLLGCSQEKSRTDVQGNEAEASTEIPPLYSNDRDCGETAVYRFDAVSPDGIDNRRIFIDLENSWSGIVSRDSLEVDSHFAGHVRDCSTSELRCLDAGTLAFAWPINPNQKSFAVGGLQCHVDGNIPAAEVQCYTGSKLSMRYRVVGSAIGRVELFIPGYPDAAFEAVDEPLPLCKL